MKISEFFQQQDGYLCALQLAIVLGFITFWVGWIYVTVSKGELSDVPVGLGTLLAAMLAAKVWKDIADYKITPKA